MKTKEIFIETTLSQQEVEEKLKGITITDFAQLNESPHAAYYGKVSGSSFVVKNVKYSPMSPVPDIKGNVKDKTDGGSLITVKMDIQSNFVLSKKMYYSTLLPIGIIVMLLSYLVLGGTPYQTHGFIFSGIFIVCAFLVVMLTKISLLSMKKRELKNIACRVDGQIMEGSEIKISTLLFSSFNVLV